MQPEWRQDPDPVPESGLPTDMTRWLYHARRFSLVRAHISVFAVGSVLLLSVNLLAGSSRVWASTWISAWALLIIMHAIVAGIATLAIQLMADDDEIRPASEVSWEPATTWTAPPPVAGPEPAEPQPAAKPDSARWPEPVPPVKDEERVSWKAASDAAWLTRPTGPDPDELTPRENASSPEKPPADAPTA